MRVIRFHGFPHSDTYASHAVSGWKAGTVEHVDDAEAERLLVTFGAAFSDETPASEPAIEEAPAPKPTKRGK
jgi:hypothetical protein